MFIDDIDRLTDEEIEKIFRLVRVNADFNKMIYVMAFDRKIVEKSFEKQGKGKGYLEKIVQVIFNVPFPSEKALPKFLLEKLERVKETLPISAQIYFKDKDENYWRSIYHSGFKNFFKTIRDIKRFINVLEFNISRMCKNDVIEVNPIDFIAIEAIRLFAYDFYLFMAHNLVLFTAVSKFETDIKSGLSQEERKKEIENALESCTGKHCQAVKGLIEELFPQIKDILKDINSEHNTIIWRKQLRICSGQYYKSYFNFIPGGDEGEISRYEMIGILEKADSRENFEQILNQYIETKNVGKVLERIQDFTKDEKFIPKENVKNIIGAVFNIYEDLPYISNSTKTIFDSFDSEEVKAEAIVYQLLSREKDKEENFNLLEELIPQTKGLYIQFLMISICKSEITPDKIKSLQEICVGKINNIDNEYLINHGKLPRLLYRWKEWGGSKQLNEFINRVLEDDKNTIILINKFISEESELRSGKIERVKKVQYKELSNFVNLESVKTKLDEIKKYSSVKTKLDEIKKYSPELYKKDRDTMDLFLKNYEGKSNS